MPQIPQIKRHFNAGATIYTIGDKAESVYLIHSGEVSILSTHGLEIGTLADGEMFGEVGRVIGSPRTVTAKAKTRCIIHEIDWEIAASAEYEDIATYGLNFTDGNASSVYITKYYYQKI